MGLTLMYRLLSVLFSSLELTYVMLVFVCVLGYN